MRRDPPLGPPQTPHARDREDFLEVMPHDLAAPLASIVMRTERLRRRIQRTLPLGHGLVSELAALESAAELLAMRLAALSDPARQLPPAATDPPPARRSVRPTGGGVSQAS